MTVRRTARMAALVALATLGLLLAGTAGSALAANVTVNSTADVVDVNGCTDGPCTLRDAVLAANAAGGSSTITLPAGTYNLTIAPSGGDDASTGDLNVSANVTINGAGASTTTVDGGGSSTTVTDRVFRVEAGGTLELSGVTIQHGHPAGGAAFPLSDGGGILALGALKLTDATVQDNFVDSSSDQRSGAGAGIAQGASVAVALTRVNVLNNQVVVTSGKLGGGGGLLLGGAAPGSVTIIDSNISGNTAAGPGGGLYSTPSANSGPIMITGTTISGNRAQLPPNINDPTRPHAFGGGIASDGEIPITLANDTIASNTADQTGGGIFDNGASFYTITDTSIVSNAAVAGFTSSGGDARGGGAITADGGTPNPGWILNRDLIALNTAGNGSHPNIPGGGIDEDGGDVFTVVNTTISDNTATGIGGGYESTGGGTLTLTNDTLDGNRAGAGSGGNIDNPGGATFTFANTIVAHGLPANCTASNSPPPTTHDHNLETTNTCGFGGSDLINTDPKLAGLALNGGPTLTQALGSGSPAIDAGDNAVCPATDQRGISRSENAVCDIGAYEFLHSITVTNANDSGPGSLRDAITLSASGTNIDFSPSLNGQTITLTSGALTIPQSLTISGPGANNLTINGNHADTVFDIEANSQTDTVTISGLTVTGGAFSGSGTSGGGGIFANGVAHLILDGDAITRNQATVDHPFAGGGGGVYANGGTVNVTNSTVTDNSVTLTNANESTNGGGGIFSDGGATTIDGSVVSNNSVAQTGTVRSDSDGGGGIYSDGGSLRVTNTTVNGNSDSVDASTNGSDGGGGVYDAGGSISLSGDTINDNTFTLSSSTVGDNGGGGVYSEGGSVTIDSSSIDGNTANVTDTSSRGIDGGGGLFSEGGSIAVNASTIADNSGNVTSSGGDNGGGAVFDEGEHSNYLNSTLSGNSITVTGQGSRNGGGAIHGLAGGGVLSDVTIAGNSSNAAGGALFNDGPTAFQLANTIVADNSAVPAGNCAGPGPFTSAGFNLESANTCGLGTTGDLPNTEPNLGPLQNNGGPTPTQALPAGSPAVDAGSCIGLNGDPVTTDQRGVARPQPAAGNCDIGAFELVPSGSGGGGGGGGSGSGGGGSPAASPPAAQTNAPASATSTAVAFAGSVNPENQATTYFFQYGIDPSLRAPGSSTSLYDQSTPPQTLPADSANHAVSATATNLIPNALYHVRLVAQNSAGTTFGPDQTFTTPAAPPPPPPALGQTVNVKPVSGQVFVLVGTTLVPLTEGQQLPSGAIVDTRAGSLQLTAALAGHKHETGVFGGAIFKLTQSHAGLTTLSLAEGAFPGAPSYAACKAHKSTDPTATTASSRTLQLLRASAHGKFRTSGRYSAATVRGTRWTIADRCDGTLTHVITDSVAVNDFVRHKTVVLHAGQSYLARAHPRLRAAVVFR